MAALCQHLCPVWLKTKQPRIYQDFKLYCTSKHEKCTEGIKGLRGIYSLNRLSEII